MSSMLAVLALAAAACGGTSAFEETTTLAPATTTTAPTTTTTAPPATTTTTTTTTLPPTTTTTLPPPVPVIGWEGEGLREIAVDLAFQYEPGAGLTDLVVSALEAMGLEVTDDAAAVLSVDLEGTPRSAQYGDAGTCFTGARVRGTLTLSAPSQPPLQFALDGDRPVAPLVIGGNCRQNPEDAPFDWTFEPEFMDAVVAIWGPAAVPYLTEILHDALYVIRIRTEAVTAYRLMDPEVIPARQQYQFMDAALWFIERTQHMGNDGEIATFREAVRRLLLAYSETDYGFEDRADILEWRSWLAVWLAGQ
ncbi:MAG: hypothetical protein ABIJ48_12770 [Actinomycetota bacterium]